MPGRDPESDRPPLPPNRAVFDDPALAGRDALIRAIGSPREIEMSEPIGGITADGRHAFGKRRDAEVVMVIPRPGGLLFHTKAFYPGGVLRLPTGGVKAGEDVLAAACREAREETGLDLSPVGFLFHLVHHLVREDGPRPFHSLGLLYSWTDARIRPEDPEEQITAMVDVGWDSIPDITRQLEGLPPPWDTWGRFRARPHAPLLEARLQHPAWFEAGC